MALQPLFFHVTAPSLLLLSNARFLSPSATRRPCGRWQWDRGWYVNTKTAVTTTARCWNWPQPPSTRLCLTTGPTATTSSLRTSRWKEFLPITYSVTWKDICWSVVTHTDKRNSIQFLTILQLIIGFLLSRSRIPSVFFDQIIGPDRYKQI